MFKKTALSLAILSIAATTQASVLTTVKPLGFIANAITDGVTETEVLLPISASPHDYSLKPSDVQKLNSADLVVWIGDEMETFLEKSIEKLPAEKVLTLEDIKDIEEFVEHSKKEEDHDAHEHEAEHHQHDQHADEAHEHNHEHAHHHDENWHIWFSPKVSGLIAEQIYQKLVTQHPDKKAKLTENLMQFKHRLSETDKAIHQQLATVKDKGYYTFHDAYGYFEQAYDLKPLGSFTINPSIAPGAKTLREIQQNIREHKATCLFTEPQFTPKVVERLSKGTTVSIGKLDPMGGNIPLSKTAYTDYLMSLANSFSQCLGK
ncbi:High-affinity zinc uptake system protein znuA precursor [Phocoenobacter uteri]|uniref:High-affinity zinc uptake system protein ZnuA n=1 Tax=Phocoenobacter uteri TaxID=146806 RepID=A0A379CBI6_9PAST|nr:zinc ABC transporter substrate-binding protein ZnuA [Phocoenobacter uteri]MDG6881468.1 zinc ABC transporter substrate-binding protein [Phocoenobacter uteri]SUB59498.1 High-affinity zinc uptake system protein znuA precursor [Phocoenobacter uteri]